MSEEEFTQLHEATLHRYQQAFQEQLGEISTSGITMHEHLVEGEAHRVIPRIAEADATMSW